VLSHPIYIAAVIPTLLVVLVVGGLILRRSLPQERPLILLLFLLELPLFFVSTFLIRQPLNHLLAKVVAAASLPGLVLSSFQAPLVEESCKLWLLFAVWGWSRLTPDNALRIGMTVGVAFGVSEIWGLAYIIAHQPGLSGYPWYYFMGFIQERLLVAPWHGIFVVAAARQIVKGGRYIALGIFSGMALHYFANFPILLAQLDFGHLGTPTWTSVLSIYILLYALFLYLLLIYFRNRKNLPGQPTPAG